MAQKLKIPGWIIPISAVVAVVLLVALFCVLKSEASTPCGSTYPINAMKQMDKEEEFKLYQRIDQVTNPSLSLSSMSKAIKLDGRTLFENSIKANLAFPYGAIFQKYNYVVCGEDPKGRDPDNRTIRVAEWQAGVDFNGISACPRRDFIPQKPMDMINFFPDDNDDDISMGLRKRQDGSSGLISRQSPCLLESLDSQLKAGLLDAISKHYMIAQGMGTTIAGFDPSDPGKWSSTKVRYAGEIIVDVKNCVYGLNNNSGTYLPKGRDAASGRDELQTMADLFSDTLGVSPAFVIDIKFMDGKRSERRYIPANAGRRPTKIQGAPPVCP